jgi:hypothetical protein
MGEDENQRAWAQYAESYAASQGEKRPLTLREKPAVVSSTSYEE